MQDKIENFFEFKYNNTDFRKETIAGITTFMGMAYILSLAPNILSTTGMDEQSVFVATALSAAIGTTIMAFSSNYPFVLAPGLGVIFYFAYFIVDIKGFSWETALAAVFLEGIIFTVLSLTKLRTILFDMIPVCLRAAAAVGVGLFVSLVGLVESGFIVPNDAMVLTMYSWTTQTSISQGVPVILSLIGLAITGIFYAFRKPYGILLSIFITWILGILCQAVGLYVPDPTSGLYSIIPDFANGFKSWNLSIAPIFLHLDFSHIFSLGFLQVVLSLLFMDLFDTLGTLMGCAYRAGFVRGKETLPRMRQAFLADASSTVIGSILGVPTTTTYVESTLGILEGGRTGFTALVAAAMFLLSIAFEPLFVAVPNYATAPALIIVGYYMIQQISSIHFNKVREGIPAFLCILGMPLTHSITNGLGLGIIAYTILNTVTGHAREVKKPMYVVSVLFLFEFFFLL